MERLGEIGAVPWVGTVGDPFDSDLAETVNGYYKPEFGRGPDQPGPPENRSAARTSNTRLGPLA